MASQDLQKPKVTLHWLEESRAQRILWLLEESNADYEVKLYKRTEQKLAPPELKQVHPLGKSPLITVDAPGLAKPIVIAESAFITEYIAEHFAPQLIPTRYAEGQEGPVGGETEAFLRYRFFMHYAEGSLMALLLTYYLVKMMAGPEVPFFIRPITRAVISGMESLYFLPNLKTHFSFLEEQVATSPDGGEYLCGKQITAADMLMSFPLLACKSGNMSVDLQEYPKLAAYIERLEANEGYQRSIKVAEEKTGEKYKLF